MPRHRSTTNGEDSGIHRSQRRHREWQSTQGEENLLSDGAHVTHEGCTSRVGIGD